MRSSTAQQTSEAPRHGSPQTLFPHLIVFTSAEVRGGDHDRDPRAKTKHGQDAGHANSSAIRGAEDAAARRFAAVGCGGGAPERTSADAASTCTGTFTRTEGNEGEGQCKVTMDEAHTIVAKLE